MPLREDRYIGDPVIAISENLLPDNEPIRRRLAERAHAGDPATAAMLRRLLLLPE
jgi:serine/threonine-protein kinase HipA